MFGSHQQKTRPPEKKRLQLAQSDESGVRQHGPVILTVSGTSRNSCIEVLVRRDQSDCGVQKVVLRFQCYLGHSDHPKGWAGFAAKYTIR